MDIPDFFKMEDLCNADAEHIIAYFQDKNWTIRDFEQAVGKKISLFGPEGHEGKINMEMDMMEDWNVSTERSLMKEIRERFKLTNTLYQKLMSSWVLFEDEL